MYSNMFSRVFIMKLVVCGGGIGGLSAAYYASTLLARCSSKKCKIIVIERNKNVGGWMKTNVESASRSDYFGPVNELGPRSVRTAGIVGNNTLQLVSDLGMEDEILPISRSHLVAKKRLIFVNKQLHELPSSFLSACKRQTPFSQSLMKSIIPGLFTKVPSSYETMHEITSVRFGDEVADYLVDAFTRGVFAADVRQLSMKAAFPPVWKQLRPKNTEMPRRPTLENASAFNKTLLADPLLKRSKEEKWTQWAMKQGFSHFTNHMASKLQEQHNVEIRCNSEVQSFSVQKDGMLSVETMSTGCPKKSLTIDSVDHVISALPSHALSRVLRKTSSTSAKPSNDPLSDSSYPYLMLGQMLNHIRWVDVAVANLEYEGSPANNLPRLGFGHLVPSVEPSRVLGVVYDSCAFPQHDRLGSPSTRLTCMMGGSWFRELFGDPDSVRHESLEEAAVESVAEQLGISRLPSSVAVNVHRKCIPTYRVGHTDLVESCEDLIAKHKIPISLVGASYWGVSINDCIFNSRLAVNKFLDTVAS